MFPHPPTRLREIALSHALAFVRDTSDDVDRTVSIAEKFHAFLTALEGQ